MSRGPALNKWEQCWNTIEILHLHDFYKEACRTLDLEPTLDGFLGTILGVSYCEKSNRRGCKEIETGGKSS